MRNLAIDYDGTEPLWEDWEEIRLDSPAGIRELQTFQGNRKVILYSEDIIDLIVKYYRNGRLIMDDLTLFVSPRLSEAINTICQRKKQYGVDLLGTCQSFMECPKAFIQKANRYVIFPTDDHPSVRKNELKNYPEVVEKYNRVLLRSKTNKHAFEIVVIRIPMMNEFVRYAEFLIAFGTSGTGKTRFIKELVTQTPQLLTA